MSMFSRIRLRPDVGVARLSRLLGGSAYRQHQYLWNLFHQDKGSREAGFLYRQEESEGWPLFYVVSQTEPRDDEGIWQIDSKPYRPMLRPGERLAFTLRANIVVTKKPSLGDANKNKRKRHDLVMEAKTRLRAKGIAREAWPPPGELIQEAGWSWLSSRADKHGFRIEREEIRADGYRQHRLLKKAAEPIRFSTLDYNGLLTVTDPNKLTGALTSGIGPAKGFGCGLLLVRRAGWVQ